MTKIYFLQRELSEITHPYGAAELQNINFSIRHSSCNQLKILFQIVTNLEFFYGNLFFAEGIAEGSRDGSRADEIEERGETIHEH